MNNKKAKEILKEAVYKKLKLSDLKPAKYNPRIMTDAQLEELEKSINLAYIEPIVVNKDLTIISGHQRYKVLKKKGIKESTCGIIDVDKKTEQKLNLSMNQISGFWDEDMRNELVFKLKDDDIPGFDETEKEQILLQRQLKFQTQESYEPDEDEELKMLFERNEKVPVKVEEPEAMHRKDQLAFYVETFEEYDKIRNFFKTSRQGELDKDALLNLLK